LNAIHFSRVRGRVLHLTSTAGNTFMLKVEDVYPRKGRYVPCLKVKILSLTAAADLFEVGGTTSLTLAQRAGMSMDGMKHKYDYLLHAVDTIARGHFALLQCGSDEPAGFQIESVEAF